MGRHDWFRQTNWNASIETAFESRLARSRTSFHKAQYLRIQGLTLITTGIPELVKVGIRLSERVLADHPQVRTEVSSTLHAIGNAHERLGDIDLALDHYRRAWAFERTFPNAISGAKLDLALLIVRSGRRGDADEALAAISDRRAGEDDSWPVIRMYKSLVRGIIAEWSGDHEAAAKHARDGLDAAAARTAISTHAGIGVAGPEHKADVDRLRQLVKP